MAEEKVLAMGDMQQFQDPKIDDGTALKLAVLLSGEEAAAADVCTDRNAGNLHDAASQKQEFSDDLSEATEISEATDSWDMCEIASISSSWLDLQDDRAVSHVIDEEDTGLEEAAQKMDK